MEPCTVQAQLHPLELFPPRGTVETRAVIKIPVMQQHTAHSTARCTYLQTAHKKVHTQGASLCDLCSKPLQLQNGGTAADHSSSVDAIRDDDDGAGGSFFGSTIIVCSRETDKVRCSRVSQPEPHSGGKGGSVLLLLRRGGGSKVVAHRFGAG